MKKLLLAPACLTVLAYAVMATNNLQVTQANDGSAGQDAAADVTPIDDTNGDGAETLLPPGADVITGDVAGPVAWGTDGVIRAYSIGTTSCNIGTSRLNWIAGGTNHPLISQHLYRVTAEGRFEHIGLSWLKHAFCALQNAGCTAGCPGGGGCPSYLQPNCSDPYTSGRNGDQSMLGPRFQVNAYTGQYRASYFQQGVGGDFKFKRVQVKVAEINPALNVGQTVLGECNYTARDDSGTQNQYNNASSRNMVVTGASPNFNLLLSGSTHRQQPAIMRWPAHATDVQLVTVDVPGEIGVAGQPSPQPGSPAIPDLPDGPGRYIVGNHVRDNGDGTWTYTYAVYNQNSHRSGASFSVPVPAGVNVNNTNFSAADYHSNEPWSNADWVGTRNASDVTWNIDLPWDGSLNDPYSLTGAVILTGNVGNALRWNTTHTYAFTANTGPQNVDATMGLYRPGAVGAPTSFTAQVRAPLGVANLDGDMNCDGVITVADIGGFVLAITDPAGYAAAFPACDINNADINDDGVITVADIGPFVALLTGG